MERGELTAVYCIGENPVQSEADQERAIRLLSGLDFLVVQDLFLTKTAAARRRRPAGHRGLGRDRGHRHQLRAARPARAQGGRGARRARATTWRSSSSSRTGWAPAGASRIAETVWNEVRRLSPVHAGMSYARLEAEGGLQWPCYDETHPGELFLHSRLWEDPVPGQPRAVRAGRPRPAGRQARRRLPDPADDRPPPRLVQHGRPDGRLHLAAPARRDPRHQPGGRRDVRPGRRRARPGRLAARPGRGPDPDRRVAAARASPS